MVVGALLNRVFEVTLTSTIVSDFFMPRDYSRGRGAFRFAPVCPSVCPSVRQALQYIDCLIKYSHSFQWVCLKSCILFVDIKKMCMWSFGGDKIIFDRITAF